MKETYHVRYGGLMRCCLASLDDALVEAPEHPPIGTVIKCKYHEANNDGMIRAADGVWEWNRAVASAPQEPTK